MRVKFWNPIAGAYAYSLPSVRLMNIDAGEEVMQGIDSMLYEPKRVSINIDYDQWVYDNLYLPSGEIASYLLHILDDNSNIIFSGVIDLTQAAYSPITEDISVISYDLIYLLYKTSDIEVDSAGNYNILTLLLALNSQLSAYAGFPVAIENSIDIMADDTVSNYELYQGTHVYLSYGIPHPIYIRHFIELYAHGFYLLSITVKYDSGWKIIRTIKEYHIVNTLCKELISEVEDETSITVADTSESGLGAKALEAEEAFLEEYDINNPNYLTGFSYQYVVQNATGDDVLVYHGPKIRDSLAFKADNGKLSLLKALKATLLMFNSVLVSKNTTLVRLDSVTRYSGTLRYINALNMLDLALEKINTPVLELADLDILRGDIENIKDIVRDRFTNNFSYSVTFSVDNARLQVSINDSIRFSNANSLPDLIRSESLIVVSIARNYVNDSITIKGLL
jgi:hypothetical protein